MPTGTVMMPLTLGRGISGINACNDASTSMLNISPQFCCLVQSLQTLLCSHSHFEIGRSHHVRRSTSINRLQAQCREDAPGATLTNSELSRMERDGVWRLLCNQRGGGWRCGFGYLRGNEDARLWLSFIDHTFNFHLLSKHTTAKSPSRHHASHQVQGRVCTFPLFPFPLLSPFPSI